MSRSKNIKIQLWMDSNYVRCVGIWYPPIKPTSTLDGTAPVEEPLPNIDTVEASIPEDEIITVETEQENDAPFIIITSSMFEPRQETMGSKPVAVGQSPMPKYFIESTIRNMSYLFANEIGMFRPKTKALAQSFISKETATYTLVKEESMSVTPVQGSQTLKELGNFINQFTEEEQTNIKVINNTEKPETTAGKHIDEYIFGDKMDDQALYITMTKLADIYETEDPYIKMTTLPTNPKVTMTPGTETAPASIALTEQTEAAIEADNIEREALETYDNMVEEGNVAPAELSREEVLEQLLKDKNQQLIDAKAIPPIIPESDTQLPTETPTTNMSDADAEYEALTRPPEGYESPTDIDDGMPTP